MFRQIKSLGPVDFKQLVYQEMAQLLCCFIPIVRIKDGLYLVGARTQTLDVNEENEVYLVERAISLEDYLLNCAVIESLRLDKIMQDASLGFRDVIVRILRKHKGDPTLIYDFTSQVTQEIEI